MPTTSRCPSASSRRSNAADGPDRTFPCGPEFGDFWASGLGTDELVLPEGVGLVVRAGRQLRLSLHLFNLFQAPLLRAHFERGNGRWQLVIVDRAFR